MRLFTNLRLNKIKSFTKQIHHSLYLLVGYDKGRLYLQHIAGPPGKGYQAVLAGISYTCGCFRDSRFFGCARAGAEEAVNGINASQAPVSALTCIP